MILQPHSRLSFLVWWLALGPILAGVMALGADSEGSGLKIFSTLTFGFEYGGAIASNGRDFLLVRNGEGTNYARLKATLLTEDRTTAAELELGNVGHGHSPSAASNGRDFLVVWATDTTGPIYGAGISGDGRLSIPPFLISNLRNEGAYPVVASDGTNYMVAWAAGMIYTTKVSTDGVVAIPGGQPLNGTSADPTAALSLASNGKNFLLIRGQCAGDSLQLACWRFEHDAAALQEFDLAAGTVWTLPVIDAHDGNYYAAWVESANVVRSARIAGEEAVLISNPWVIQTGLGAAPFTRAACWGVGATAARGTSLGLRFLGDKPLLAWISNDSLNNPNLARLSSILGEPDGTFRSPPEAASAFGLNLALASNGRAAIAWMERGGAWISQAPQKPLPVIMPFAIPAYVRGTGPHRIVPAASLIDEATNSFGALNVSISSGRLPGDKLSLQSQGLLTISGTNIHYAGAVIGSFMVNTNSDQLRVVFNPNATRASVEEVLRNVSYENMGAASGMPTIDFDLFTTEGNHSPLIRIFVTTAAPDSGLDFYFEAHREYASGQTILASSATGFLRAQLRRGQLAATFFNLDHTIASETNLTHALFSEQFAFSSLVSNGRDFLLVWKNDSLGPLYGAIITTTDGIKMGASFVIRDLPPCDFGYCNYYGMAVASDGVDYLVAWIDRRTEPFQNIYGTRIFSDGRVAIRNGQLLATDSTRKAGLSAASNGQNYLLVWSGLDIPAYGLRVGKDGAALGSPFTFPSSGGAQWYPKVASRGSNYLVVWTEYRGAYVIYGSRVSSDGAILDPSGFAVNTDKATEGNSPQVAFLGDRALVSWLGFNSTILVKVADANGRFSTPPAIFPPSLLGAHATSGDQALFTSLTGNLWLKAAVPNTNPPPVILFSGILASGYLAGSGQQPIDATAQLQAAANTKFGLLTIQISANA